MHLLDALAEERICEAQQRGDFDDLPGAGRPLELSEDALVPEELRVGYRLLRNAGFVPPELEVHGEMRRIEQLLRCARTGEERAGLITKMNFFLSRAAGRRRDLRVGQDYIEKVSESIERRRSRPG